ncbi:Ubiquitin-conjugating enzyme E2 S [Halotydeus destructor]|nr:Ubiquitin-conjugating enzyme E2 S [Halotydeus destructor]
MASSNVENLSPQVIRQVTKEITELIHSPPEGIRTLMNEEDVTDIQAIIDGPAGTPYSNGAFRVRLILSKDFPQSPPKGYFVTKIFHPNVSRNGEICVNTLKKDWKPDLGLKHVFLTVKCLLIVPNAESALNEEAGKLLLEHYDDYCRRAKMMTDIHARIVRDTNEDVENQSNTTKSPCSSSSLGPHAKKHAGEKSKPSSSNCQVPKSKNSLPKDKKRTLKRL